MARKKIESGINVSQKLRNVRILYETGKIKEAIAYLYAIYTMLAGRKFGVQKLESQTMKEFAKIMVMEHKQNSEKLYGFIQRVEQSIYSGEPVNLDTFQTSVELFADLYQELTNTKLPSF